MKLENSKPKGNFQNLRNQTNFNEKLQSELQNVISTNTETQESLKVFFEMQQKS